MAIRFFVAIPNWMRRIGAARAAGVALWFMAVACAAGCAVQGRVFEKANAPEDRAVIYLYRPYSFAGSLLRPPVTCGESVARVGPGGYQAIVTPPGKIICHTETETADEVEIDARPGGIYYLKEEIGWGVAIGHPHLYPMDSDSAQTEIQKCCVLESPPS
jgi:hypothetical protein